MIYTSVTDAFPIVTRPLEGCVLWPYLDVFGLATVGFGCLCNTVAEFEKIDWVEDPSPAFVAAEFEKLKRMPKALHWRQYERATNLRMTRESADRLLSSRATDFASYMQQHYFSDYENWPADAQLSTLLMSWACGPGYPGIFKTFTSFAKKRQWTQALACAAIKVGTPGHSDYNPGIVPRNAQVALCLRNAADIDSPDGYGTPALYWPGVVKDAAAPLEQHAAASVATFAALDCGLTGHCHELAA